MPSTKSRAYQRVRVRLEGELISHGKSYNAYVRNVSDYGVNVIVFTKTLSGSKVPERRHELIIHLLSEETISLHCEEKWSSVISPRGTAKEIGMTIIDPPGQYKEFIKTLH
jgi:hypothetical protein